MDLDREIALVEAVLFLEAEPIDIRRISRATGLGREAVERALDELQKRCRKSDRGVELSVIADGYLLAPKRELWETLRGRYGRKNENRLSRAAMETLSIVAYSQPITRAEIESIRGVSSDNMIRLLVSRNLVQEVGRKDAPGRPVQYGTTQDFLKVFRLSSIADLPKLDELDTERFELDG